jgi:hypothetical protein
MDSKQTDSAGNSLPQPLGSAFVVGGTYDMRHERFGRATVKVVEQLDETWIRVEVIKGVMRGIGAGAVWGPGDTKQCRISHCYFYAPNNAI